MKKNLILGLSAGYSWTQLRAFVESIRSTSYKDHIVLFFDSELDPHTIKHLKENSVEYIYFNRQQAIARTGIRVMPLSVLRVFLFLEFLQEQVSRYENVMFTDTRDVIFQKDPFDFDFQSSLCLFMEPKSMLIKDDDWNSLWIISAVGTKIYHSISTNPISCCGTTLGPVHKMIEYLQVVSQLSSTVKVMFWGIEQGIHNYIAYANIIEDVLHFTSEKGPILTIGAGYTKPILQDSNGFFLNEENRIIYAIHQYDRHSQLKEYFDKKFSSNVLAAEI